MTQPKFSLCCPHLNLWSWVMTDFQFLTPVSNLSRTVACLVAPQLNLCLRICHFFICWMLTEYLWLLPWMVKKKSYVVDHFVVVVKGFKQLSVASACVWSRCRWEWPFLLWPASADMQLLWWWGVWSHRWLQLFSLQAAGCWDVRHETERCWLSRRWHFCRRTHQLMDLGKAARSVS